MDEEVFNVNVVPLLGIDNTALLAISTPDDEDNYYSDLMTKRHPRTGLPLFLVLRIQQSCTKCVKAQVKKCIHQRDLLPSFKSKRRQELVEFLLENDEVANQRENMGMVASDREFVFDEVSRIAFKDRARFHFTDPVRWIFVGMDPSAGGKSEHTLSAQTKEKGHTVVSFTMLCRYSH